MTRYFFPLISKFKPHNICYLSRLILFRLSFFIIKCLFPNHLNTYILCISNIKKCFNNSNRCILWHTTLLKFNKNILKVFSKYQLGINSLAIHIHCFRPALFNISPDFIFIFQWMMFCPCSGKLNL